MTVDVIGIRVVVMVAATAMIVVSVVGAVMIVDVVAETTGTRVTQDVEIGVIGAGMIEITVGGSGTTEADADAIATIAVVASTVEAVMIGVKNS